MTTITINRDCTLEDIIKLKPYFSVKHEHLTRLSNFIAFEKHPMLQYITGITVDSSTYFDFAVEVVTIYNRTHTDQIIIIIEVNI